MKRLMFAALMSTVTAVAVWADGNITGSVIERETGEPLEFANITLENSKGRFVAGVVSETDGSFTFKKIPDGAYVLRFTYVGTVPQSRPVTVKGGTVTVEPVHLAQDSEMLQEVVVEGVRGQMRFELDRKVFNVDASIGSAGMSASELLESIPSVEVDQDGEVSLRGNSSVTVWINGKESGLTADNRAQILEQIPAETIERIEVITNPSAKYSPEGTAGIINIVLKKDRTAGYFGSAEVGGNTRGGANANFNININTHRWETYAGIGLRMRHNTGGSLTRRDYTDGHYLYSDGDRRNHGANAFLRLGATYHITDNDDVYANAFGMLGHRWGHTSTLYTSDLPGQWATNHNHNGERGDMRGSHIEAGYIHRWSDSHSIDVNGAFNHWGGPSVNTFGQQQAWADAIGTSLFQSQSMNVRTNSMEFKVDYTNQLTERFKLEAGYNGNYSHENTPVVTLEGPTSSDMAINPSLFNRFIYDNNITAFYATFGGKLSRLSFSAGVRAEAWQIRTRSLEYGQHAADVPAFRKDNFALFPSAFISYSFPHDNEIQINYTRRIRRPWGGQLNSFRNISDPTNITYGNPELQAQYANSFELNYIKTWDFHMLSFSAYVRSSENNINRISYLDGDVMYTTFANVGTQTNSGCEIVAKNSLWGRLDLTTTVNLYNRHVNSWSLDFVNGDRVFPVSGRGRDDFSWDVRCMASVRLPWSLSFQATGRYNAKEITAQGERGARWSVDAGIRRAFGNWSVSLNCRDIFDSRKWHNFTYGDTYTQENQSWRGGRRLQLTVKYSFGNMNAGHKDHRDGDGDDGGGSMDGSGYSGGGDME